MVHKKTQRISCGEALVLGPKAGTIRLTPKITTDEYSEVDIAISFTEEGEEEVDESSYTTLTMNSESGEYASSGFVYDGVADLDVEPAEDNIYEIDGYDGYDFDAEESTVTSTNTTSYSYNTPTYYGSPDLKIYGAYASGDTVRFNVTNSGSRPTGSWYLSYTTPTSSRDTEYSGTQVSLNPGEALAFTLRFNDRYITRDNINIYVDPNDSVSESNESNNSTYVSGIDDDDNYRFSYDYDDDYRSNRNRRGDDADLRIDDLEAGYVTSSGSFREDDDVDARDAAIRFTVENVGDDDADDFEIEITYPSEDGGTERITKRVLGLDEDRDREFIIELDDIREDRNNTIEVEVDADDDVDEENERNNDEDVRLRIS